ncbi:MAG: hypothetical protein ACRDIL_16535, partial [Candidatus Limnocylindrales bacterium]
SIPGRFSGLGSAINNAIARVGQPLLGALIFVAISATFYGHLGSSAPGLDLNDPTVRTAFPPLNPPRSGATADDVAAAANASIRAFHDAMRIGVVLLVIASVVSWFGLRDGHGATAAGNDRGTPDAPAA